MIFVWFKAAALWFLRLFIPPPAEPYIPRIDPNAVCPSCGNCEGRLEAVKDTAGKPLVKHECRVCRAEWFEKPVLNADKYIRVDTEK